MWRDNIVIDGSGHCVRGGGINLVGRHNVTITKTGFIGCFFGIYFNASSDIRICENMFKNNYYGLAGTSGNFIYHNNFINNTHHFIPMDSDANVWDEGYPSGGNYWSDYIGVDEFSGLNQDQPGSDGIGDQAYNITQNNTDRYPLMKILDEYPPIIWSPTFEPSNNIHPGQEVRAITNSTDEWSGIKNVTLFYTTNNGTSWESILMPYTGVFKATIPGQPAKTIVKCKVIAYDNAGNNATTEEEEYIVMSYSWISISTSATSTYAGFAVDIYGTLCDMDGEPLESEPVVLYYTFQGVENWLPITSDVTDDLGHYYAKWIPSATGYFVIKAEWSGNATYFGTKSNVSLSALPYQNQYVFSVESNSTVTGLAFNTTSWELGFSATGPSGTRGYVRVTVAKSLVANVTNIRVSLDGNESTYSVTSIDDSWLVTFDYMHSTHQVIVDLDVTKVPEFPSFFILPLLIMTTLLIVTAHRRKHSPCDIK
jgi:parallel beta-helix repeat protein